MNHRRDLELLRPIRRACLIAALVVAVAGPPSADSRENTAGPLATIETLRLAGKLKAATAAVATSLADPDLTVEQEIALRLELARIHDRVGLHTNTRPVAAALAEIERAETLAVDLDGRWRGSVTAAKASYYYRAEMANKEFQRATELAHQAMALLEGAGDLRRLSDATHQLGLIHLMQREFPAARDLFDESLALDESAGARPWLRGEFHRHVGFIHSMSGDWDAALPHFERSLEYRLEAGAVDASLFAAISLGLALVRTAAPAAAEPHLEYALEIAADLGSVVGRARVAIVLGEMYEALGDPVRAREAYRTALDAAVAVRLTSLATRAEDALRRLGR